MNADIHTLLVNWQAADKKAREAAAEEVLARLALISVAFPSPVEGTNNAPLGNGDVLKGNFKNNYNVDNSRAESVAAKLPPAVARNVFKWKASLSLSAYKALESAHRDILNEVITITPGRPTIEVVTPKER